MTFTRAMIAGVGVDGCDIVPEAVSPLPGPFFRNIAEMSARDVAYVVASAMMGGDIAAEELRAIVSEWITDDFELCRAGGNMYAFEPTCGPTMSEYDVIGRLFAVLIRHLYDRQEVSVDTVFCSPSRADSAAAISHVFNEIIGKSPIMFQAVGTLTEMEKRQFAHTVPHEMVYTVACDEASLSRVCKRAASRHSQQLILVSDSNVVAVVARVFMYFEAYRLLCVNGVEQSIVVCVDSTNEADVRASQVATQLELPVRFIMSQPVGDIGETAKRAFEATGGYIVCPRSAAQWSTLADALRDGETGVFVQHSHPAKSRFVLEPILNKVIPLPHKLHYDDVQHVRYRRIAPSVNAIINCFTKY